MLIQAVKNWVHAYVHTPKLCHLLKFVTKVYLTLGRTSGFDSGILMAALSKGLVAALYRFLIAAVWDHLLKNTLKY